ncbi:hypothetical protein WK56_18965 [Burkholderia ubonensis]|nr:hypothetical protein WK56_18965 [Burkholderia ubonensis]
MFDFSVFRIPAFTGAIFGSMGMNFSFWPFIRFAPRNPSFSERSAAEWPLLPSLRPTRTYDMV